MDNFRKTIAYKICGFWFFISILLLLLIEPELLFDVAFFWLPGFMESLNEKLTWVFILNFIIFILCTIIAFFTKDKYPNSKYNKFADFGYILMCFSSLTTLLFFANYILLAVVVG